jgi:hypothetical protein
VIKVNLFKGTHHCRCLPPLAWGRKRDPVSEMLCFSSHLEVQMMDKVHKTSDSETKAFMLCVCSSSRINRRKCNVDNSDTYLSFSHIYISNSIKIAMDRLCCLVVRVPGYTTEMYFLWGTNWIYICYVEESRPHLLSCGQSSWLHNGDVLFPVRYELNLYMLCRRK